MGTIANEENYRSMLEEAYSMQIAALKEAKKQLIKELFQVSDVLEQRKDGKWRLKGNNIQNECIVEVMSKCGNPTAQDLKSYRWIPIICKVDIDNKEYIYNYRIDLFRQDIDIKTYNFHLTTLGNLQIWHDLVVSESSEKGGSLIADSDFNLTSDKSAIMMKYPYKKAFPVANRSEMNSDKNPWGYEGFENSIPQLDIKDEKYKAEEVAKFFLNLIRTDIEHKVKDVLK